MFARAMLVTSTSRTYLQRRYVVNTIPHHAIQHNLQKPYTVYALVEPVENFTWAHVRYIGMSTNVLSRYAQHLSCRSADSNDDKNEWIQRLLRSGQLPVLYDLEQLETKEQALEREQYYIRYAMSQGAHLLNHAITMTEQEKMERHIRRARLYAQIEKMLASGTFVKREGVWYPTSVLDRYMRRDLHVLAMKDLYFVTQHGQVVSLFYASDEDFTAFISQYITIFDNGAEHWDLFGRMNAIGYACYQGKEPEFCDPPPQPEKKSRHKKGK